jgi:phage gp29-like protein
MVPPIAKEPDAGHIVAGMGMGGAPPMGQYLDNPVLGDWRSTDSVSRLRDIMVGHERGMFLQSAMFVDEMLTDDRIRGVLDTRIGGILAAPLVFTPADDRRKSQKLAHLLDDDGLWMRMIDYDTAAALLKWKIMLGVALAEIVWVLSKDEWIPRLVPWHPRHLWWNWGTRVFQLATAGPSPNLAPELQRQMINANAYIIDLPRVDTDSKPNNRWFIWGRQYSWMEGAVRSLGMKFVDRQWTERDWARYCEKHGMAIIEGKVPSGLDDGEKNRFMADLHNVGNEATIITPQAMQGMPSYGIQLHEASAQTWQTFKARKESLDADIAVQLLGQNMTTEAKGAGLGSGGVAAVHEGIRLDKKRQDAELFRQFRSQVLIPWAEFNYGKGEEIAPYPEPQIEPPEDEDAAAGAFLKLGQGLQQLKLASPRVDVETMLEAAGIPMLEEGDPRAQPPPPPVLTLPPGPGGAPAPGAAPEPEPETPPGEQPPSVPPAPTAARAYLAANFRPGTASAKRVARYQDAMARRAAAQTAQVMGPTLEMIREDLESVGKLDVPDEQKLRELKKRVIRRYPQMPVAPMAGILKRLNEYWGLAGRDSVTPKG